MKFLTFTLLIAAALSFAGCRSSSSSGSSSKGPGLLSLDETDQAAETVLEANKTLQKIKTLFKENEPKVGELQQALKSKDTTKVRELTDGLVTAINEGVGEAREAIDQLKTAKDMNINDDYRNYLELKIEALEKYVEAFEERRQAAILLRDGYDPKNAARRDEIVGLFKQREEKFRQLMDDARAVSEDANDAAKASMRK